MRIKIADWEHQDSAENPGAVYYITGVEGDLEMAKFFDLLTDLVNSADWSLSVSLENDGRDETPAVS